MPVSRPLGEVLVEERLISREQLQAVLARQRETGAAFGKIVLEMGFVDEAALVEAVARQIGIPYVDLVERRPDPEIATMLPPETAKRHVVVPVDIQHGALLLAMAEPTNRGALREVAEVTGYEVKPALAVRRHILATIEDAQRRPPAKARPADDYLREAQAFEPPAHEEKELSMHELLERMLSERASDLHLTCGAPPTVRVRGHLQRLEEYPILQPAEIRRLIYTILTQRQRDKLENDLELDLAYSLPSRSRFRVNVFFQRDAIGAVFRAVPMDVPGIEALGLPPKVADFARMARGLILVTGPTGHGKSTTLAALIDIINRERPDHIMTVEDPIEYLHSHKTAVINQREVGADTRSFSSALRHVLRQDPDVILVGEMRDLETIQTALTAAETGHLVFATLHTQDAPQSIDRVIDVFPPHQQQQVRVQLAASIQGIVTQQLLPTIDGSGRAVACEILVATPAIRNLVREGKTHMIYSAMQAGGKFGMQTMDQALGELVKMRRISYELGLERCHNVEDFNKLTGRSM